MLSINREPSLCLLATMIKVIVMPNNIRINFVERLLRVLEAHWPLFAVNHAESHIHMAFPQTQRETMQEDINSLAMMAM